MRSPEEVAREIVCVRDYPDDDNGGMCRAHLTSGWPCNHRDVEILSDFIRARDAEIEANVLRFLNHEWGNTFNDYRTDENIVIYTSPSRQSAIERAENSSGLIAVQRRVSEWEPIKTEDEDE